MLENKFCYVIKDAGVFLGNNRVKIDCFLADSSGFSISHNRLSKAKETKLGAHKRSYISIIKRSFICRIQNKVACTN